MFRFMALAVAPVAVVNPLMRTGSVFTLVLSFTINRHLEVINRRVVAGIIISVTGVMLIVINRV
jgi:drug/metabolite transporter (DMT)-like permease